MLNVDPELDVDQVSYCRRLLMAYPAQGGAHVRLEAPDRRAALAMIEEALRLSGRWILGR